MTRFADNPKWLLRFAPFRGLSISGAYIAPFFLEHGLSQTEIFVLQSIFSVAVLLWELPSGYLADKLGRARCIKASAPIAALGMIAYGFSDHFWQFAVCEIVLAIATGLMSGADTALLYDSLKATGRQQDYEKQSKRINARVFASSTLCMPLAIVLVSQFGIASTLIADGLLTAAGIYFAWQLSEAPRLSEGQQEATESAWYTLRLMIRKAEVRWLLVLGVALSTATYLGYWWAAPYYQSIGIPVAAFAGILAVRSLWKAAWSHWYHPARRVSEHMFGYAMLVVCGYLAMMSGQWWLLWLLLGHDIVHAMQGPALLQRLNGYLANGSHRATLNSAVNLLQRLAYAGIGPVVGLAADLGGLRVGMLATGVLCGGCAFLALLRLHHYQTFREGR